MRQATSYKPEAIAPSALETGEGDRSGTLNKEGVNTMLTEKSTELFISDNVTEALAATAATLQARFAQCGDHYDVERIQGALKVWLELSIEQLADDALFHCAEGDSPRAFNRRAFLDEMNKVQPIAVQTAA
jgi:hypothetical protein